MAERRQLLSLNDPRHGTYNGYVTWECRCGRCTEASRLEHKRIKDSREPLDPNDPRHGTWNGYCNWKCRCDRCKAAASERNKKYSRRRRTLSPSDPRHGTMAAYQAPWKCRCDKCKAGYTKYQRNYKFQRRKDIAAGRIQLKHGKYATYWIDGCRCDLCTKAMKARQIKVAENRARIKPEDRGFDDTIRHGTGSGYMTHKCRCVACKTYYKEYQAAYEENQKLNGITASDRNKRQLQKFIKNPELFKTVPHGKTNTYKLGCRCSECRAASAKSRRERYYVTTGRKNALRVVFKEPFLPEDDPRHGTLSAYTHHKCRCDKCRKAVSTYVKEQRQKISTTVPREDKSENKTIPHGTRTGYEKYRCSCKKCRDVEKERARNRREKTEKLSKE